MRSFYQREKGNTRNLFYLICNPVSLIKSLYDAKKGKKCPHNVSSFSSLENIRYNLKQPKAKGTMV